ncbi:DUF1750-domain-containing protein [Zopfia rhizophila CBS 207.26]|uniref:DUF1750-domain-containing protein n=1 Tax=Zopfia rhizophila CBS 207.26 TaxID=1314779 RepID=A0A6A6EWU6_9PEZI|nr:DUF1750-domain-containing protein [Zopfia rhizophila CBS 207.26]
MMNQNHMAQDPSALVPTQILPHVHLVSSYRFPTLPNLQPAQALEYLIKGPQIVNDTSPVAWTYFAAPPADGSVLMTWQPPLLQTRFASDGMVWADPEVGYTLDIRGYSIEMLIHQSGFRYGYEQFATHARTRFRIVRGPGADSSLWIVHYHKAEPGNRFPANRIQLTGELHVQMQQRSYLEKSGQLLRKEFMLRDRSNWPEVKFTQTMPGVQNPPRPYYNPMQPMGAMSRQPQYYQQHQVPTVGGPPPPKRMRQAPPSQQPGGPGVPPSAMAADSTLEDEENTTLGDSLDYLTPREISLTRYTQHHEWMEEIFSSPYAAGQIVPIDLGLGLMGELAPLTDDILDPTAAKSADKEFVPKNYHKLDPERLKEFEKRVADYTAKEEAELERMRAAHTKKITDLKRSRTYIKAERRLREVARNGNATDASRMLDSTEGASPMSDPSQGVMEELENSLGVTFDIKKNAVCIDKGGFIEEQQVLPPAEQSQQVNGNGTAPSNTYTENGELGGLLDESAMDAENSAASLLDQYGSNSLTGTPGANLSVPQISQPQSQSQSAIATPNVLAVDPTQNASFEEQANIAVTSSANDLVDLDVEMSGMTNTEDKCGEGDWVMVDQNNGSGEQAGSNEQPATSTDAPVESADQGTVQASGVDQETTTSMFDTAEFGGFDNLDTAGDALADYTNDGDDLGLDLDNSAFGDAFHGTETHHDETEDGDNA